MKMKGYDIAKDPILKYWIVWECHRNYKKDIHHGKTKKECKEWLDKKILESEDSK